MLRLQKKGRQKPWTLDELEDGLEKFFQDNKRYPTATEVDLFSYLPSARSIERRFGGLVELRKHLNLKSQSDFRSGQHSTERAFKINKRAHIIEKDVYDFLVGIFNKEFVHREYFFTDDKRTRADFFIYDQNGGFCIDVFYPSDKRNLIGCLNSKLKKFESSIMKQYPVIFLQMNDNIDDSLLIKIVQNKINKLNREQQLMGWKTFLEFCKSRKPIRLPPKIKLMGKVS